MSLLLASIALASTTLVPLNDLGATEYLWGYFGGLWDKTNVMPADHAADGLIEAAKIEPLDAKGRPDPNGKIVFMSVGYGNTQKTFDTFMTLAAADPHVNHDSLVFLNAAGPGLDVMQWEHPWQPVYQRTLTGVLDPAGLTAAQVQAVWIQEINEHPFTPLPIQYADSYLVKASLANTLRSLKTHFPNLRVAYLSSPEYSGYNTDGYLGEPFAYEDAFSVRWVLSGQIEFMRLGEMWDPRIADLSYKEGVAPWVTWGPYLWANGMTPRSDGLTWERSDFGDDGGQLSDTGARKSAGMLMKFMLGEPTAANWFLQTPNTPATRQRSARH